MRLVADFSHFIFHILGRRRHRAAFAMYKPHFAILVLSNALCSSAFLSIDLSPALKLHSSPRVSLTCRCRASLNNAANLGKLQLNKPTSDVGKMSRRVFAILPVVVAICQVSAKNDDDLTKLQVFVSTAPKQPYSDFQQHSKALKISTHCSRIGRN